MTVLFEKASDRICSECGEDMILSGDYGPNGDAFHCRSCGFFEEVIDLRDTVLSPPGLSFTRT
jgi:hypothetical protein